VKQVTNIGTDPRTYRSEPMIDLWKDARGVSGPVKCCVRGCDKWATDGAHVRVGSGTKIRIVPMCHEHNMQKGRTLWVRDEAQPVLLTSL
jgi:hypothetical protein